MGSSAQVEALAFSRIEEESPKAQVWMREVCVPRFELVGVPFGWILFPVKGQARSQQLRVRIRRRGWRFEEKGVK